MASNNRIKGITVEIGGDVTKLDAALRDANKTISGTQTQLKDVERLLKLDPTNTELLAQKQKLLSQAVEATREKLTTLKEAEAQAQEQFQRGEISQEQYMGLQREIIATEQQLSSLETQAKEASNNGLEKLRSSVENVAGKLKDGLVVAAKAAAAAVEAVGAAVVSFAKDSVEIGKEFDSSMSQVAATMGVTVDEIAELRDFALEMGSNTAFSASQAAEALNYMALAGYDAETSMSMLPNVLNLAAAGGINLAAASDMVTDAQSALGLSLDETSELVDKMAQASSKSNTSVSQLGEAILTIGGTAKNLAGGTTELSSALGILADNGVKGSAGGTALRNIILALSAPTDKAAKALASLGVEAFDADGNMRPLNETFADLNEALSSMTQGEQTQVLNEIFNKNDLKSVNALLANTGERFNELGGYIDKAKGSAEEMAKTQLDNLAGDITMFQSAMEGAQIIVSDQLTPSLREFVQFGTEAIGALSAAFQEGGLSGAMEALGTILSEGLNLIIAQLPSMIDAGMQLLDALGQGLIDNLPALTEAAVEILTMLGANLPLLVDVALQLIIALANGLADSLPELIPAIVEAVVLIGQTLIDNIPLLMDAAWQIIVGIAEGLMAAFPELAAFWETLKAGFAEAWERVKEIWSAVTGFFQGAWNSIKSVWDTVSPHFQSIWESIKTIFSVVAEVLGKFFSSAWEDVKSVWNAVSPYFSALWNAVKGVFSVVASVLGGYFSVAWDAIKGVWNVVTSFFESIWNTIDGTFSVVANVLSGDFSAAWAAIKSVFSGWKDYFVTLWDTVKGVFSNAGSVFSDIGKNIVSGIKTGISNAWSSLTSWVTDKFDGLVSGIKGLLGIASPSKVFAGIGGFMAEGLGEGWDDEFTSIRKAIEAGLSFNVPGLSFAGAGAGTVSGFASTIGGGFRSEPASGNGNVSNSDTVTAAGSSFNQVINISAVAQTPSEVARQTRNATRQMLAKVR